jgi:hypothetical protein
LLDLGVAEAREPLVGFDHRVSALGAWLGDKLAAPAGSLALPESRTRARISAPRALS